MVFVTGKHYYALARHAEEGSGGLPNVAFVRLEQLCPFPTKELQEAVAPFKRAKSEYTVGEREGESESPQSPPIFTLYYIPPQSSCGPRRSIATWAPGSLSRPASGT